VKKLQWIKTRSSFATVWHDDGWMTATCRQPIYEKDRMDPVDPAASLTLDPERLAGFGRVSAPRVSAVEDRLCGEGNLPGLRGAAVQTLYDEGRMWLAGSPTPGVPL
jgi:hypothetical protein